MRIKRTPSEVLDDGTVVFSIGPDVLVRIRAWQERVDRAVAEQQARTGLFFNGSPLNKDMLQSVRDSIERGDPTPYYGAIGGAYAYCFIPTGLGYVFKVRHTETGDEIDLTDYDAW